MNASQKQNRGFFNPKAVLGIVISLAGLYLGFRKFDAAEFLEALRSTRLLIFGATMLVMVFQVFLRALRWRYLILPLQSAALKHVFGAQMICYFGNHVFPLRFGEILRSYALNQTTGIPAVSIFGTVVIERVLDVTFFLIILPLTVLTFFPVGPDWLRWSGGIAAGLLLLLVVAFLIFRRNRTNIARYLNRKLTGTRYEKLLQPLRNFSQGLATLRATPHLGTIALATLIIWVVSILNVWIAGLAVNISLGFANLLLLFFVTSAIIAVPSAPGYVGTYHAGAIGVLLYMGYELSQAQVTAVILHAVGFISLTLIGFFYFIHYHLHVSDTTEIIDQKKELD